MTKTWGMKPELVIEMIQASCRHAKNIADKTDKIIKTNEEIIKLLRTPKKPLTRY